MKNKIIVFLFLLSPFISIAQLKMHNQCDKTLYVAIKYIDGKIDLEGNHWTTIGWFEVKPQQTIQVVNELLVNRTLYIYAYSTDKQVIISGDHLTCASYNKFQYYSAFADRSKDYCSVQLPFVEVDTQNSYKFICDLCIC